MLVHWNPWGDLSRLERDIGAFFDGRLGVSRKNGDAKTSKPAGTIDWQPAVDVIEEDEQILLVADLPGIDQKDVDITIDEGVLTLRGERKTARSEDKAERSDGYQRLERVFGAFARSFTLPKTVDVTKVAAEMHAGVLTVKLPKVPEAQPRQIKVQVA